MAVERLTAFTAAARPEHLKPCMRHLCKRNILDRLSEDFPADAVGNEVNETVQQIDTHSTSLARMVPPVNAAKDDFKGVSSTIVRFSNVRYPR